MCTHVYTHTSWCLCIYHGVLMEVRESLVKISSLGFEPRAHVSCQVWIQYLYSMGHLDTPG